MFFFLCEVSFRWLGFGMNCKLVPRARALPCCWPKRTKPLEMSVFATGLIADKLTNVSTAFYILQSAKAVHKRTASTEWEWWWWLGSNVERLPRAASRQGSSETVERIPGEKTANKTRRWRQTEPSCLYTAEKLAETQRQGTVTESLLVIIKW